MKFKIHQKAAMLCTALCAVFMATSCTSSKKDRPLDPKVEKLKVQEGFVAEHVFSPSENEKGSWVSMAFDDKGRMIASDQSGALYRLEIPAIGADSNQKVKVEKLILPALQPDSGEKQLQIGYAHGLLWAFNSLYVMVNHRADDNFEKGSGLYRMQDTDGDDSFDRITLLKSLNGQGEHGPHSIVLAPDSSSLYVIAGNHTDLPAMDAYRLPPVWAADNLFPQIKDPRGHANNRAAPGGWIARTDSLGKHWELISAGYRNPFDMAFNTAGDLFTYDSDMEWDFGLPWYRPTRICHVTSGSEYGWRTGNGKWRPFFTDNLPPVLNIGPGSPTNLIHARNAKFPDKYRKSLFAFDWSFGIIYNVFLEPKGASYTAKTEEFLSGIPLPLTDGMIGPDGALYFLTGGRGLQSDLYRVYYDGDETISDESLDIEITDEHKLRTKLEQFHKKVGAEAVDFAWPYLKHPDRFVKYAARIAVENQALNLWQNRALNETDPDILIQAAIALARHADVTLKGQILTKLMTLPYNKLKENQQLDLLRTFELTFSRMGLPNAELKTKVTNYLSPHYPSNSYAANLQFSKLLVFLEAPDVIEKTLGLMEKDETGNKNDEMLTGISDKIMRNPQYGLDLAAMLEKMPPASQVSYATILSSQKSGWTPELREKYFNWFYGAFAYQGGRSYIGFIDKARQLALSHVPENKYDYYNTLSGDSLLSGSGIDLANIEGPKGPGRNWTIEEALPLMDSMFNRDFERGRQLYVATNCIRCHSIQGQGGIIGPDLTQLGTRFSAKDILEAIVDPNKVISDQYAATVFQLKDGKSVVGVLTNQDNNQYYVSPNPFVPESIRKIPKADVANIKHSKVSVMLPGLINSLNEEELKNLMAYLISGANPNHQVYKENN